MTEPAENIEEKIAEAGVYDIPMEVYHGDCCVGPSISNSGIKQILADPAEYWRKSALNPDRVEQETKRHFNIGTSAHLLFLEPDTVNGLVSVVPSDILASNGAMSTKAAKEFKAKQEELGRTVITENEWKQSLFWQDEETGVWLKTRPDTMPRESGRYIVDYKTTDFEDIASWERQATADTRLDIQAASQLWGCKAAAQIEAKGVLYIVQSKKPPHRVALRFIHAGSLLHEIGRVDLRTGINSFAQCWETGEWPSPWDDVKELSPPDWRMRQIERQLEEGSINTPNDALAA